MTILIPGQLCYLRTCIHTSKGMEMLESNVDVWNLPLQKPLVMSLSDHHLLPSETVVMYLRKSTPKDLLNAPTGSFLIVLHETRLWMVSPNDLHAFQNTTKELKQ